MLNITKERKAGDKGMIANYAQLGKSELIQLIGIQQDKEKLNKLTINDNGETIVEYKKNIEREKYGDKKCLSTAPLLIWMYLHFLSPDENGNIDMLKMTDIVKDTGFTYRTCKKAIEQLEDNQYILKTKYVHGMFSVRLADFKNYFLSRKKGGKGYIELQKEKFLELLKIAHTHNTRKHILNTIRLILRLYMLSEQSEREFRKKRKVTKNFRKTLRSLTSYLPKYFYGKATKQIILAANDDLKKFGICIDIENNEEILFCPENDIAGAEERKETFEHYQDMLHFHLIEIEDMLQAYIKTTSYTEKMYYFNELRQKYKITRCSNQYVQPVFNLASLAQLAVEYSLDAVKNALSYLFSKFSSQGIAITNTGGLVRQIIKENI